MNYHLQAMDFWYQQPLGQYLLQREHQLLQAQLASMPGHFIVQLGGPNDLHLLNASTIPNKCLMVRQQIKNTKNDLVIQTDFEHLPLLPNSIDVAVIVHALEFIESPQSLLNELYQAIRPGGQVIIFHFNSLSLLGWQRLFFLRRGLPWSGEFQTLVKLQSWLGGAGYSLLNATSFCFTPLLSNPAWQKRLSAFDRLGKVLVPHAGGVMMLVAKKQSNVVVPLQQRWRIRKVVATNGYVEPTARVM